MTEFTVLLSNSDTDLLFYLKQKQGFDDMTGNQFAERLLEEILHRLKRESENDRQNWPTLNESN